MATTVTRATRSPRAGGATSWARHLRWFAGGVAAAFLVPFVFSSLLDLHHDIYLAVYFGFVTALMALYTHRTQIDVGATVARNWRWGVVAGVLVGIPVVGNVFSETETARPDGLYFAFELVWRGATYGAMDAVLLTVFPCVVVYASLGGPLRTWRRRITYFFASLALVMVITASYHLGYEHYRDDGVGEPETGNVLMSLPMLLTTNPLGSIADHSAMHVAAVVHEYEGDTRLPPQADAD
jgi:hypothetical protein